LSDLLLEYANAYENNIKDTPLDIDVQKEFAGIRDTISKHLNLKIV
jgi:hypothetical protein